jgi:hypothetical protein
MLRLVLDAVQTLRVRTHPLAFEDRARWYSEARLRSPFAPRKREDPLGEGFTNADGIIGQFAFGTTLAGLRLNADATQFVVVEAKMFSNLSAGTKNAKTFNQAARNVACMATAIAESDRRVEDFTSLGFFVLAPTPSLRGRGSNLEASVEPGMIRNAVRQRIGLYERNGRMKEAEELHEWEMTYFRPLVDRLSATRRLAIFSWDECIEVIADVDSQTGDELRRFYNRCLSFGSQRGAPTEAENVTPG